MARITTLLATTTFGLLAMAGVALADMPGFAAPEANLRAGPGRDYPFVAEIHPGAPVDIHGCVGGYGWCDVDTEGLRGWIAADKLRVLWGGHRVLLRNYAPEIALPVVTFDLGDYWGRFYPQRPFYAERFRFAPELGRPGYAPPHETIIEHNTIIERGGANPPGREGDGREPGREPGRAPEPHPTPAPAPAPAPAPTPKPEPAPHEHDHGTAPHDHATTPPASGTTPAPSTTEHHKHDDKTTPPGG